MKNQILFPFIALSILFFGCVSQQKHKDALLLKNHYKMELDSLKKGTPDSYEDDVYGQYDLKRAEFQLKEANEALTALQDNYDNLEQYNKDILYRYDEILDQNRDLLSSSSSDAQQITAQLYEKERIIDLQNRDLQRLQNQIRQLEGNADASGNVNTAKGGQPIEYQKPIVREVIINDCQDYERQIMELNSLLQEKEGRLRQLRTGLNKALLGFSSNDLSVTESQGKIYVSLSQNLLFAPNSDRIDQKGKQALRKLANVLNNNRDININVEGHTDPDGSPQKNWNLSVSRATSVVNVLTANRVDPKRITASGKSFYAPIASNNTVKGKAKNRRTEIILTPRLDELYRIINN